MRLLKYLWLGYLIPVIRKEYVCFNNVDEDLLFVETDTLDGAKEAAVVFNKKYYGTVTAVFWMGTYFGSVTDYPVDSDQ